VGARSPGSVDLATILQRAGEKVADYFVRAQSLVCLDLRLQPLGMGLTADGFARVVESELRLSWDPFLDTALPPEAKTLRQVLKVNGHPPRKNDRDNCTSPEQQSSETQPLSMSCRAAARLRARWRRPSSWTDGSFWRSTTAPSPRPSLK
jgi:hypothetical protein